MGPEPAGDRKRNSAKRIALRGNRDGRLDPKKNETVENPAFAWRGEGAGHLILDSVRSVPGNTLVLTGISVGKT